MSEQHYIITLKKGANKDEIFDEISRDTSADSSVDSNVIPDRKVDTVDSKDKPDFGKDTGEGFEITDSNVPTGIVEDTEGSGEFSTPQRQRDLSGSDKKDFGPYQDRAKAAAETRSRNLGSMRGGVGRNNPGTSDQGFTDSGQFAGL